MVDVNRQWLLKERPTDMVERRHFDFVETEIPEPTDGTFVVRNQYLSLDPAMRGWLNDAKSYIAPVAMGEPMRALGLGKVVASKHEDYPVGCTVNGLVGVQDYCLTDGNSFYKVEDGPVPLPYYLSVLGMPGMTAYFGLLDVGQPKEGETLVVSAASGAVGSVVGQIGRIKGCRTVAIAGGPEKCAYCVDVLGFDAAIDYKNSDVYAGLKEHCPKGIDIYFDNVGGDILDATMAFLRRGARIVVCGAISQYNKPKEDIQGPKNYLSLLVNRARMEGMVVLDYVKRYGDAALEMGQWLMEGKLKSREHIEHGLENFPEVLGKLFSGGNFGKLILALDKS